MEMVKENKEDYTEDDMPFGQGRPDERNMWEDKQHLDIVKHYSEDELVPEDIRKRQWAVFGKAFVNTFLEEMDLPMININFELLKINEMTSKPAHLLTFKEVNELDKMSLHMFLTAKRAIGSKTTTMNERILQNTMIQQNIGTQTINQNQKRKKILGLI